MKARYTIALSDGTPVGFVTLPQRPKRDQVVRLHPLPAFRVAREARRLYRQFLRGQAEHHPLTEEDMVAEEKALTAFGEMELHLVKQPSGRGVINAQVNFVPGEPPRVRITFWRFSAPHHDDAV